MDLDLVYPGDPKGQGRPRASVRGGGVRMHSPKSEWFNGLKIYASTCQHVTDDPSLPLRASIACYFRRPKAHYLRERLRDSAPCYYTSKPDADNIIQAVLDALVQGGALPDDRQVSVVQLSKFYVSEGQTPETRIKVEVLP
jgi:Holliday junction resolvase RusA-like endonuclease